MNFGHALQALRDGKRVTRPSWVGGAALMLVQPITDANEDDFGDYGYYVMKRTSRANGSVSTAALGQVDGQILGGAPVMQPWIGIGSLRPPSFAPWTPTQEDLLADDWRAL